MKSENIFDFFKYHNMLDVDGRPLSEESSFCKHVSCKIEKCHFHDYRHGFPMNVSAFRQLSVNMQAIKNLFYLGRKLCFDASKESFSYGDFWKICQFLRWYPIYLARIDENYIPSAAEACMYKSARGLHDLAVHCIGNGASFRDEFVLSDVIKIMEENQLLKNKINKVCPAPVKLIASFLEAVQTKNDHLINYNHPETLCMIENFNLACRYASYLANLELLANIYAVILGTQSDSLPVLSEAISEYDCLSLFGQVTPLVLYLSGGLDNILSMLDKYKKIELPDETEYSLAETIYYQFSNKQVSSVKRKAFLIEKYKKLKRNFSKEKWNESS